MAGPRLTVQVELSPATAVARRGEPSALFRVAQRSVGRCRATAPPVPVAPPLVALGIILAALAPPSAAAGQVVGSERATLTQTISGTEIVLDYARPSVRGREDLFGGQIPWGEVWTPGANEATTVHFSRDVTLNGREVPAGTYSVWMQVLESDPWIFVLHPDTTLYHTQHPSVDEGFLTMPVEPGMGSEFTETLTFDLDAIRADGAVLRFRWGLHRVAVDLGVDPGYVLTVEAEEAARYVGEWTVDRSMGMPSDSAIASWRADMPEDQLPGLDEYLTSLEEPSTLRLEYDAEGGRLLGYDASFARQMGGDPEQPQYQLVTRADGIFYPGMLINGELAFLSDASFWEFEFDADGQATRFVERGGGDRVTAIGSPIR
jgi:hypothetical protein